jgi:hypothetical protein
VQVQYLLIGLVVNIKQIVKLLRPQGGQLAPSAV